MVDQIGVRSIVIRLVMLEVLLTIRNWTHMVNAMGMLTELFMVF